ncbi:MAG: DUF3372 domain-containing protein, partial [bacterium]|nr:DUF3372 domain-containing protein [bacterium]
RGDQIDYNGSPAGYTEDPQENIVYVSAHDNETLFDVSQYKHPLGTSTADRARAQNLGIDITALAQGVNFFHAGVDMLRSKSLDRDSFNSGDWFNRLDFEYQRNNWGVGLPVASKNQAEWPNMQPLLADPSLTPVPGDIAASVAHLREILAIKSSTPLFNLTSAQDIQDRVAFHNTGPAQVPGMIVMSVSDLIGEDLDPGVDEIVVVFNATDGPQALAVPAPVEGSFRLHPVQRHSADPVVRTAAFDSALGTFTVPARTTAVFESTTSLGALGEVLAHLEADPDVTGDHHGRKAINHLRSALNPVRWLDGDTIKPASKRYVYNQLRKAVLELRKVDGLSADTLAEIAIIHEEARAIAVRAIDAATAAGGRPRHILRAWLEILRGDIDLHFDRPDKAIQHYGKACVYAHRAIR